MKDKKLPNSSKSKVVKKLHTELPPQKSAFDTSNWENRNVGAVTFDTGLKERTVRMVDFMIAEQVPLGISLKQLKEMLKAQGFTPEQIQKKIEDSNNSNKTS
jgi:hypothetical protein